MSETTCPNCGASRTGAFCGHCGQNSRDYNTSLWTVLKNAITELFELDGRVVRSIRSIVFHPGQLSLEFADNRRADFVNPFRLFMFTTILWFFLFGVTLPSPDDRPFQGSSIVDEEGSEDDVTRGPGPFRLAVDIDADDRAASEADIAAGLMILRGHLNGDRVRKFDDMIVANKNAPRLGLIRGLAQFLNAQLGLPQWLQRVLSNVVVDFVDSPQFLVSELIDNLPLMMVVLLPWYAILLTLFFGRTGKRFVHHLVFAIHVHSFSFIVLTVVLFTPSSDRLGDGSLWEKVWNVFELLALLFLMVHTFFAYRRFYQQGHVRTLVKYLSLGFFYLWGLFPAFSFVLVLLLTDYL